MPKTRKKRTQYSTSQKRTILATAVKDKLTAAQVQKKFGVTPVTYYSWRRKTGVTRRGRPGRPGRPAGGLMTLRGDLQNVRADVQARVRQMLPTIVRGEVDSFLNSVFGPTRRRRTRT